MVLQHAGGVGRCAKARGMEPVYGVCRAVRAGKLNESLCLSADTEKNRFISKLIVPAFVFHERCASMRPPIGVTQSRIAARELEVERRRKEPTSGTQDAS
jgi:hypothetical protein